MKHEQLWQRAWAMGIRGLSSRSSKTAIIRAIQEHLGEIPCFASPDQDGCARACEWREDCQAPIAIWRRH